MSNAPKVTIEDVNASIKETTFTLLPNGRTTVCQLTLDNGFTVEGQSSCVSIENYNEELGNKIAYENAVRNIWQLLGFRLADVIKRGQGTVVDRLRAELFEVSERVARAEDTLTIVDFQDSTGEALYRLLEKQVIYMKDYRDVLAARIELLK